MISQRIPGLKMSVINHLRLKRNLQYLLLKMSSKRHIRARTKITKPMATIETCCLTSSSRGEINSIDKRKRTLRYLSMNLKTPMSCWS